MNNRKLRLTLILIIPVICVLTCGYTKEYDASESKVYDYADIFTNIEEKQIQEICLKCAGLTKLDVAVATINDSKGKSTEKYADVFFDAMDFGYDRGRSGVLLLIDMDNREFYISTSGIAMEYFKDDDIEKILTDMDGSMVSENYKDAFLIFASDLCVQVEYINEYSYDSVKHWFEGDYKSYKHYRKRVWYNPLVGLIFSISASIIIFCILLRKKFKINTDNKVQSESQEILIHKSSDKFFGLTTGKKRIYTLNTGSSSSYDYGLFTSSGGNFDGESIGGGDHGGGGHSF